MDHDFADKQQNRLHYSQTGSQLMQQCFVKPQNDIFVWQDRFYRENVAEEEANCKKFLQKYLYFKYKIL